MYIAALDVLSKSKKYAKSYITPEAHPNLVSLNPNETALYWYNNPYTIINTDAEQAKKKGIPDYKISMDPGTYPNKVLQAAQELKHYTVNSQENPSVLPAASVVAPKKITPSKQKYGGWLNQYSRGGVTWLNEYQKGGQAQPIFVSDLNDPRYKSYQDSLGLYKKTLEIENPKYYTNGNPSWYRWKGNTESV